MKPLVAPRPAPKLPQEIAANLKKLSTAQRKYRQALDRAETSRQARDEFARAALEAGARTKDVAAAMDVTPARIAQLYGPRKSGA